MPNPISPAVCPHLYRRFVFASPLVEARDSVWLCPDCGQFQVDVWRDGLTASLTFTLNTTELVEAAARHVEYILAQPHEGEED